MFALHFSRCQRCHEICTCIFSTLVAFVCTSKRDIVQFWEFAWQKLVLLYCTSALKLHYIWIWNYFMCLRCSSSYNSNAALNLKDYRLCVCRILDPYISLQRRSYHFPFFFLFLSKVSRLGVVCSVVGREITAHLLHNPLFSFSSNFCIIIQSNQSPKADGAMRQLENQLTDKSSSWNAALQVSSE